MNENEIIGKLTGDNLVFAVKAIDLINTAARAIEEAQSYIDGISDELAVQELEAFMEYILD